MTDILSARYVHCVGIGGIGLSGLARLLRWQGMNVTGSDLRQSVITDDLSKLGIMVFIGPHASEHVASQTELVIRSVATAEDNPELIAARQRGITVLTYPEAVGQLTDQRRLITVSGTHGKTTTTAMIGQMLIAAGLDPTVLVGSRLTAIDGNARHGHGEYFVLEGDEYGRAFLNYHPEIAVITNIEPDHLDVYHDIHDLKDTFEKFTHNIKTGGHLVYNADDANTEEVASVFQGQKVSFGLSHGEYHGTVQHHRLGTTFNEPHTGTVALQIPGVYNVSNALAAITVGHILKIPAETIIKSLNEFTGLWRRFELVGECQGAKVISDYAHHPTAVRVTVAAAREYYPDRRLIVVFQPHHRHRTQALFNEFVEALTGLDHLILQEIYDVAGRESDGTQQISSRQLVEALDRRGTKAVFTANDDVTETTIRQMILPGDVILIMGAGSIDAVARNLTKS